MDPLTEISLFTGCGGFTLGLRLAGVDVRTVCYVEKDPYCQRIIDQRIAEGHLDDAPLWDDITTFDGRPWRGHVDIVTGGFPCQPHSTAGKRLGASDERNLWPDTLRVISEVGPGFVLLENVPGILANGYGGTVVGELAGIGYDCVWHLVPAAAVGAPHLRWRWWCLAYSSDGGQRELFQPERQSRGIIKTDTGSNGETWDVADTDSSRGDFQSRIPVQQRQRLSDTNGSGGSSASEGRTDVADAQGKQGGRLQQSGVQSNIRASGDNVAKPQEWPEGSVHGGARGQGQSPPRRACGKSRGNNDWWAVEPEMGRVADGIASRVDRLRACGNGIVPAVVAKFLWGIANR